MFIFFSLLLISYFLHIFYTILSFSLQISFHFNIFFISSLHHNQHIFSSSSLHIFSSLSLHIFLLLHSWSSYQKYHSAKDFSFDSRSMGQIVTLGLISRQNIT